jgi:peptidoglycan/xylan/chitin deacetylase (PgdA/CDA1 family)
MPDQSSVFLMYHELEQPGRAVNDSDPGYVRYVLTADAFAGQMEKINELGLRGTSISEALRFTRGTVAITFDDGCATDLTAAAPILKRYGFGATFYVVSGFVNKNGFLSQEQLRELVELGFEIGCHSMTHPYLPDLDDVSLRREIADAKTAIEQMIGKPVEHFSCPGGRYDSRAKQTAMAAGYATVATSIPHANTIATDRFLLGRVAVTRDIGSEQFEQICRGEGLWQMHARTQVRDGMKRLLGNRIYDRLRASLLKN